MIPYLFIQIWSGTGKVRAILKKKIPEFSEDKRYHLSEKCPSSTEKDRRDAASFHPTTLQLLTWEMESLVTEARLNNAISKVSWTTFDFLVLVKLMILVKLSVDK